MNKLGEIEAQFRNDDGRDGRCNWGDEYGRLLIRAVRQMRSYISVHHMDPPEVHLDPDVLELINE